ncbi:MAG TPA: Hsp20/alpha crystallin family protein [Gemmatimonadales bacterium]|nr:Hsp20/alpha crystallin family protein [Gemmatimonadales bacterium]
MIEIPVPGLDPDEVVIEADAYTVVVPTEPRTSDEAGRKYLQRGRLSVPMSRVFDFPVEIDADNVQATLEKGILKLRVPKAIAARRKVIRVRQSG